MAFTSYAQNFEDIMLWRALKHVTKGFYIDVGANDPQVDSVTRAFYDRGWRGINVEPMQQYQRRLKIARPSDINLAAAVGDDAGELTFYDIADTGLSTMDAAIAVSHAAQGRSVTPRQVKMVRLADICRDHVTGPIHFLKIDVEGFEAAVLRGMDFTLWRPWILVIEATLPQTQTRNTDAWQSLVLSAGYQLAYFDGLNDFYVAHEHTELLPAFAAPPNYFDEFTLRAGHFYSHPLTDLEHQLWQAHVDLEASRKGQHETNAWAQAVDKSAKQAREQAMERDLAQTAELETARLDVAYMRQQLQAASARADYEANSAAEARAVASSMAARARAAEQLHAQATAAIAAIYASTSWRLTRPIRVIKRWVQHPEQAANFLRTVVRRMVRPAVTAQPVSAIPAATPTAVSSIAQSALQPAAQPPAPPAAGTVPTSVSRAAAALRRAIDSIYIAH